MKRYIRSSRTTIKQEVESALADIGMQLTYSGTRSFRIDFCASPKCPDVEYNNYLALVSLGWIEEGDVFVNPTWQGIDTELREGDANPYIIVNQLYTYIENATSFHCDTADMMGHPQSFFVQFTVYR